MYCIVLYGTKIEGGRESVYFEMESKQEDHAETYDDVVFRKDTPQAKPNVKAESYRDPDTVKHHRLFFIASTIAVAFALNSLYHFGFSCGNHDSTERSFYRYGYHCSFLL